MTELIGETLSTDAHQLAVKVPVKVSRDIECNIEMEVGRPVTGIIEIIAIKMGWDATELIIVGEDDEEQLTAIVLIEQHHSRKRHHIHHVKSVDVTVFYNGRQQERNFRRHSTIDQILNWAIVVFGVDAALATEFELAIHGHKEELPGSEHLGHVAGREHAIAFDLVRGDIANGAPDAG